MEHIAVEARHREPHLTKGARKELRHQGMILGAVYGRGIESVPVTLKARDLSRVFNAETGMNTLIDLQLDGKRHLVRVSKLETDPITHYPLHISLQTISATEPQKATISLEFTGEPEAVRAKEGLLEIAHSTIDVRALPEDIVSGLTLDVSDMTLNSVKRAGDVKLPKGYELLTDPDASLVSLHGVQKMDEEFREEAAEAATESESPPSAAAAE
jgi:large subunit ribosomal protein L25